MPPPDEPTRSLPDGAGPPTKSFAPHGLTTTLSTSSSADATPLTVVADRYELGPEIARGGMGVVYAARDRVLHRDVAVKLLQDRFAPDSNTARRFVEEARIAGQLQHPGVPPVHDLGTTPDGRPFLAMKLIKGQTLSKLLASRSPVSGGRQSAEVAQPPGTDVPGSLNSIDTFLEICQTVAYAHDKGVVHRDLKPANVMVGAFGEVQVMDWGLAKVIRNADFGIRNEDGVAATRSGASDEPSVIETDRTPDSATQAGSVLGTPAYMPPEQAKGEVEKMDARTDVFALGALLCELLTGKPPYTGTFDEVRARSIIGDLAPALARLAACGGDPPLVDLAVRCLAADPEGRPANAGAVAAAVAAQLERAERERAEAVVSLGEQRKRRRVWYALAACLVAGLAASLALAAWALESRAEARYAEGVAAMNLLDTIAAEKKADARRIEAEAEKAKAERELDRADRLNYANQLAEADRHWREWNPALYFDRLNAIRWDFRGPEWNHFWQRAHELFELKGHASSVLSVAVSPDGRRIVSGSDDNTVRVWDAATLAPVGELKGHRKSVWCVVVSPDGRRIISGSADDTVRVWDAATLDLIGELKGHTGPVRSGA